MTKEQKSSAARLELANCLVRAAGLYAELSRYDTPQSFSPLLAAVAAGLLRRSQSPAKAATYAALQLDGFLFLSRVHFPGTPLISNE